MRSACVLLIGNEILSGRTKDANLAYLGERLNSYGIRVMHARVIPDIEQVIIDTVKEVSAAFDYVFTTGGIGPTHDDITAEAVAKALGSTLERNAEAVALLEEHYAKGETKLNEARLTMADIPVGAKLIYNRVSAAPGFILKNVYVMAGVPSIMRAMIDSLADELSDGAKMHSETIEVNQAEGDIAEVLGAVQVAFPEVEIGCYPKFEAGRLSASLVIRSTDANAIARCSAQLHTALAALAA